MLSSDPPSHVLSLATAFLEICDTSDEDAFWVALFFFRKFKIGILDSSAGSAGPNAVKSYTSDIDVMISLLRVHSPTLLTHIESLGVSLHTLCDGWFRCFFSNIISTHAIEGVWDIVIGGAPGIMPYLGLSLLYSARRKLEACRTANEFAVVLNQISQFVDIDAVANMSIDLWEMPGYAK
eukprot:jgi/Hompol1/5566/HPOL_000418-RA